MLKSFFGRSDFLKNTFVLILGTGLAQAIPILLQPVLRRIYAPEDFGAFAVYFSLIGILTVVANFRYDMAIGLPESDEEGANILSLSLFLNLCFNIFLFFGILFFKDEIAHLFRFPEKFSGFLFILPVGTFLFCSFQAMNYWLIRKKAFRALSVNKVSRRGAEGIVQISFGLFKNSAGLFWADVAGSFSNNISGLFQLKRSGFRIGFISRGKMKYVLSKYAHFPKFNLVPHLLGTLAMQFPVFIINKLFTKTELGFFDLTQQAILAPFALITVAVSQVLLQVVTEKRKKKERLFRDFMGLSLILLLIGIVSLIIIEIWGPPLFAFVFGGKWITAGIYSQTLIFAYLFFLVAAPMGSILLGLEEIRSLSLWNLVHFLLMAGLLLVQEIAFPDFLKIFAGIEIVAFSILYLLTINAIRKYEKNI